jgi:hypothetical protein
MKNISISFNAETIDAARSVLDPEEDIASFADAALRYAVERRRQKRSFLEGAMRARKSSRDSHTYVSMDEMLKRLEAILDGKLR